MTQRRIAEMVLHGHRLGRHVDHDPRSLNYLVQPTDTAPVSRSHRRYVPIFDQGNLGSCHDAETEILTRRGWLPFPDLTLDNELATVNPATGDLVYERPIRIIAKPYSGDIYSVRGQSKDFAVTPDHMMLVRRWDERARTLRDEFELVPMKDVGWYSGLMSTVKFAGTPHDGTYRIPGLPDYKRASQRTDLVVPMTVWLRFLGIYLAEGTMLQPTAKSPYKVQIAAVKAREKVFVRAVLAAMGLRFLELPDRFTFENGRVYRHMQSLGLKGIYAAEKFVPEFVFEMPGDDIAALLEGHREGDGSFQDGCWTHHTSSPQLADDLQRLILLAGGKTGVSVREPRSSTMKDGRRVTGKHREYGVRHLAGTNLSLERRREVRVEHRDGMVYCAEVPTFHTLVTRRNGKILIAGNCTGNAAAGTLGTAPLYGTLTVQRKAGLVLDEAEAVSIYSDAERLDGGAGLPTEDNGSSGLSVAKVARARGLIASYLHITSLPAAHTAIATAPFLVGSNWYSDMDEPNSAGLVTVGGTVRGGHEYEAVAYNATHGLWKLANSWSSTWGKAGYFYLTDADLARLLAEDGDATVFQP